MYEDTKTRIDTERREKKAHAKQRERRKTIGWWKARTLIHTPTGTSSSWRRRHTSCCRLKWKKWTDGLVICSSRNPFYTQSARNSWQLKSEGMLISTVTRKDLVITHSDIAVLLLLLQLQQQHLCFVLFFRLLLPFLLSPWNKQRAKNKVTYMVPLLDLFS